MKKITFNLDTELMSININLLKIQQIIAKIDDKIDQQVNAIIHDRRFQQIESSWRGLLYLVEFKAETRNTMIKIKVLDISLQTLSKSFSHSVDFDQSELFKKIYSNELDHPGGEPFGLIVGDYYFDHLSTKKIDNISILAEIAKIMSAAFVPFITGMSPSLLGLDSFTELHEPINITRILQQTHYLRWKSFTKNLESHSISFTLPRILMRKAYATEKIVTHDDNLWGNPAYCFATVAIRSFTQSKWFADIRGINHQSLAAGMVTPSLKDSFNLDKVNRHYKSLTEIIISDSLEKELSKFGLMALCQCYYSQYMAFHSAKTLYQPPTYASSQKNANIKINCQLNYLLCAFRFAHYIKKIIRDKIGSYISAQECQQYLQNWVMKYCAESTNLSTQLKAQYPLRYAQITVLNDKFRPGHYICKATITPRYLLEKIDAQINLVTEFSIAK